MLAIHVARMTISSQDQPLTTQFAHHHYPPNPLIPQCSACLGYKLNQVTRLAPWKSPRPHAHTYTLRIA